MIENLIPDPSQFFKPRNIAKFVVASSVRFIVSSAISTLVPAETKVQKTKVFVGSWIITGIVAEKAASYFDKELDEFLDVAKDDKEEIENNEIETDIPTP